MLTATKPHLTADELQQIRHDVMSNVPISQLSRLTGFTDFYFDYDTKRSLTTNK